jgi:hypothetical protein
MVLAKSVFAKIPIKGHWTKGQAAPACPKAAGGAWAICAYLPMAGQLDRI